MLQQSNYNDAGLHEIDYMKTPAKKTVVLVGKIVIAAALLAWVLAGVHWSDYVVDRETGKAYTLISPADTTGPDTTLTVQTGLLWWASQLDRPAGEFVEIKGPSQLPTVVHPGFASSIKTVEPGYLAGAAVAVTVALLMTSFRWWLLLGMQQIHIRLWETVRLTFLGMFFNAIVPGTVGGDLVKAYAVAKHTPLKAASFVSVLIDRVLGLVGLTLLASGMLVVVWAIGLAPEQLKLSAMTVAVAIVGEIAALGFLASARLRRALHLEKLYQRLPIAHHVAAMDDAIRKYVANPAGLARALGLTLVIHCIWITSFALIGRSLSLPTPVSSYFLYIPLVYIVGAVPLTPGGVGLVERLFVLFFVTGQATPSMVLALALLARALGMVLAVPGAAVAIMGVKLPKTEAMEHELGLED